MAYCDVLPLYVSVSSEENDEIFVRIASLLAGISTPPSMNTKQARFPLFLSVSPLSTAHESLFGSSSGLLGRISPKAAATIKQQRNEKDIYSPKERFKIEIPLKIEIWEVLSR